MLVPEAGAGKGLLSAGLSRGRCRGARHLDATVVGELTVGAKKISCLVEYVAVF
jgi:hypothetical protein